MPYNQYRKGYVRSLADGMAAGYKYAPVAKYLYRRYAGSGSSVPAVVKKSYRKYKKRNKYKRRANKRQNQLRKDVKDLKEQVKANTSKYIQLNKEYHSVNNSATNTSSIYSYSLNNKTNLNAAIDAVKYFDPDLPGTLINVDLTATTYQNQVRFTKSYGRATIRNNYSVPCKVSAYVCVCKEDTSISCTSAISNSLADMSNTDSTDVNIYPTMCHDFNDLWKIQKSKTVELQPGETMQISQGWKPFRYDISLHDSHGSSFQNEFYGSQILLRVQGVVGHGSTSGVALSKGGVDIVFDRHYTIEYPGGTDLIYIESNDSPDTVVGTLQMSTIDYEQSTYAL